VRADDTDDERLRKATTSLDRMVDIVDDVLTPTRTDRPVKTAESVALVPMVKQSWTSVASNGSRLRVKTEQTVKADRGPV
jgi:hypothetical protein